MTSTGPDWVADAEIRPRRGKPPKPGSYTAWFPWQPSHSRQTVQGGGRGWRQLQFKAQPGLAQTSIFLLEKLLSLNHLGQCCCLRITGGASLNCKFRAPPPLPSPQIPGLTELTRICISNQHTRGFQFLEGGRVGGRSWMGPEAFQPSCGSAGLSGQSHPQGCLTWVFSTPGE